MLKRFFIVLAVASILLTTKPVSAQTTGPIYIVQSGDTLSSIALRFNVTVADLLAANNMTDPNLLAAGQQLIIPGLDGVTGVLDTEVVNFGDSFHSLVRRTQVSVPLLRKLNRLISPTEFYVGTSMIIPKQDNAIDLTNRFAPAAGESLLETAVKQDTDPWTVVDLNNLKGTWDALPDDVFYAQGQASQTTSGLPSAFVQAQIRNLPLKQGGTAEIIIQPANSATLSGTLVTYPLHFFPLGDGRMVALQGIHAMLDPGVYPLHLDATLPDGSKQSFEQMILINSGNYPKESLSVSSELIDPAVTDPENKQVESIVAPITNTKTWQGNFSLPVYVESGLQPCIYDWFGTRRSFNGGGYDFFHSGIDYGVCFAAHPFDIYAAAPGTVIFAAPLTVRGNATFIDHGWGVYTAYYHQKEIDVSVGQQVQTGQLIGLIGATGRVTGPHLHWEVWVNGIQVDPLDWLNGTYP
jgi:murein DD-endopeptidase MepM/ murein hydrolase activator NlpD